jgi:hypothetical protein
MEVAHGEPSAQLEAVSMTPLVLKRRGH